MLSFLFPQEHSSHSMHTHCHVYYPLRALPALHNPSPTKSLSHSPVFLFSVCSCFVVQCGMAPKRRKFLLQSQHNFGILPSRCVVSSAIDSYHIVLEVNQEQIAKVIACVDLTGLLGSIHQLTVSNDSWLLRSALSTDTDVKPENCKEKVQIHDNSTEANFVLGCTQDWPVQLLLPKSGS